MKTSGLLTQCFLITFLISIGFLGCASRESSPRADLLTAAGFLAKTPKTDAQKQAVEELPNAQLLTGVINGQRLYGYRDDDKGVVYVGNGQQYQTYKHLAAKQNIASEKVTASEMDPETIKKYRTLVPYGYWR